MASRLSVTEVLETMDLVMEKVIMIKGKKYMLTWTSLCCVVGGRVAS